MRLRPFLFFRNLFIRLLTFLAQPLWRMEHLIISTVTILIFYSNTQKRQTTQTMKTQYHTLKRLALACMLLSFFSFSALAQKTVDAADIMKDIKAGKDISYENVTVTGVLDFTYMEDKEEDLPVRRRWWRNGGSNKVNEVIESKISFVNVTFEEDVLAYYHNEHTEYTFTADFENDVIFENCTFQRDAMFKYSQFDRDARFEGSAFNRETTFKYAEFEQKAQFSATTFEEDAIFKYTKFYDGVSFEKARFERSLDMKYTKVRGDFDTKGLYVRWDIDTKYTKINGRGFSKHMLDN